MKNKTKQSKERTKKLLTKESTKLIKGGILIDFDDTGLL